MSLRKTSSRVALRTLSPCRVWPSPVSWREERGHGLRDVVAVDGDAAVLEGGVRDAGQRLIGLRRGVAVLELDGDLAEVAVDQFARRAKLDDVAVVDDGDAVAELLGLFEVVRGEHDRLAAARAGL